MLTSVQLVAAFEEVLYEIYEKTIASVVYLRVESPASAALRGVPGIPEDLLWSAGSGFVWDDEGHIVTNHHVVEDVIGRSEEVTVFFADSSQAKATVVGSDPHSDLAVIKLEEGDWQLQPATLGDSSEVKVGQLSVALGAPFGQEFTMTSGIVSAVGRNISGQAQFSIPEVIQTDSAINPGNSGGPLLNRLGQVIGINTQIISRTGNFSGVGMAVPVNIAKRVVPPLIENGEFNYPWLGVRIATVDSAYAEELGLPEGSTGVLIIDIVNDSPADKAGMRASESTAEIDGVEFPAGGDIITAIGAHRVAVASELIAHLTYHNSPGDEVTFTVLRDGEETEVEVTLGKRPISWINSAVKDTTLPTVGTIYTVAVKSLALQRRESVSVGPSGIAEDRRFHLIDGGGRLLTQRQRPILARVFADYDIQADHLTLAFPEGVELSAAVQLGETVQTPVWGRLVPGRLVEGQWNDALSSLLAVARSAW